MSGLGWLVILGEIAMVLGLALALVVPPRTSGWSHRPLRAIRRRTRRCGHERGAADLTEITDHGTDESEGEQ